MTPRHSFSRGRKELLKRIILITRRATHLASVFSSSLRGKTRLDKSTVIGDGLTTRTYGTPSTTLPNKTERLYFLDVLRPTLMMLGVVFHSALIFIPEGEWLLHSDKPSDIGFYLAYIIHLFRMPAFFIVSGFFCVLAIQKYSPRDFLRIRLKRVAIPLLATALLLNSLQTLLLSATGWMQFELNDYIDSGKWVSHLWFLNNLIFYFFATYLSVAYARNPIATLSSRLADLLVKLSPVVMLLLLPGIWLLLKVLGKLGLPIYWTVFGIDGHSLVYYSQFFLFGSLLYVNRTLMHRFANIHPMLSACVIGVSEWLLHYGADLTGNAATVAKEYLGMISIWFSTSLCFYLFSKYANREPTRRTQFLADASYTVYLFHHGFVIGFGLLLIKLGIGGFEGLLLLTALTIAVSLVIHKEIILKVKLARYIFNGKGSPFSADLNRRRAIAIACHSVATLLKTVSIGIWRPLQQLLTSPK
jgi:glucans biosynthesis protein C